MNRRELLKFTLLTPFLGLFKSRKSGASTGLTLDKLKECRDELEKNSLKPDENGMINLTTDTSGGDYTCWRFLDEEPEIYNDTLGEHPAYVVWWDSKEKLSRFKRISNEEFYRLRGNEEERTLF